LQHFLLKAKGVTTKRSFVFWLYNGVLQCPEKAKNQIPLEIFTKFLKLFDGIYIKEKDVLLFLKKVSPSFLCEPKLSDKK